MKKRTTITSTLGVIALLLTLGGCGQQSASSTPNDKSGQTTGGENAKGGDTTEPSSGDTAEEPPKPTLADLPASLKHEGLAYFGLAAEPMKLEMKSNGQTLTGTQRAELQSIEGDKATFKVLRTGDLANLGSETLEVDSKGIRIVATTLGEVTAEGMEMPANIKPGDTWKNSHKINTSQGMLEDSSNFKVVGTEKVKTKSGTFDALVVESDGTATIAGAKQTMKSKWWYVKDRGAVKLTLTATGGNGVRTTTSVEEVP